MSKYVAVSKLKEWFAKYKFNNKYQFIEFLNQDIESGELETMDMEMSDKTDLVLEERHLTPAKPNPKADNWRSSWG